MFMRKLLHSRNERASAHYKSEVGQFSLRARVSKSLSRWWYLREFLSHNRADIVQRMYHYYSRSSQSHRGVCEWFIFSINTFHRDLRAPPTWPQAQSTKSSRRFCYHPRSNHSLFLCLAVIFALLSIRRNCAARIALDSCITMLSPFCRQLLTATR